MSDTGKEKSTARDEAEKPQSITTTHTTIEDQAPTLVRYYVIAGLVTFFIMVTSVALIMRQFAIAQLIEAAEDKNHEVATQFVRESWHQNRSFVMTASTLSTSSLLASPKTARLEEITTNLVDDDEEVIRINLYDDEGFVAFSTQSSEIGQNEGSEEAFHNLTRFYYRQDALISERIRAKTFDGISGPLEERQIVRTYTRLEASNSDRRQGVMGVFRDITAEYRRINRTNLAVIGVAFLIMVVPVTRMLVFPGRPDARQHGQQP